MLELLEDAGDYITGEVRRCSRCGAMKPLAEFPIKNKKTGLRRVWCRDCCRAYGREHYQRNSARARPHIAATITGETAPHMYPARSPR